jgi:hypothetical protein
MMYKEIIVICSQSHTEHTDSLGKKVEFWIVNLEAHTLTTGV